MDFVDCVLYRMQRARFARLERKWMLRSSENRIVSRGEGIILVMLFIAIKKRVSLRGELWGMPFC